MILRVLLFSSLVLFADFHLQQAIAQSGSSTDTNAKKFVANKPDETKSSRDRVDQLVSKLKTVSREVERLQAEVGKDGIGSTVVRLEVHRKSGELRKLVTTLITALNQVRELGSDTTVETKLINDLLARDAEALKNEVMIQAKRVRALVDRTATGSSSERVDAELSLTVEIPILEILDTATIENLSMRESIGADVSAERAELAVEVRLGGLLQIGMLRTVRQTIDLTSKLTDATGSGTHETALRRLKDLRRVFSGSVRGTIRNLDKLGTDTSQLKQQLISLTGEFSGEILDPKIITPLAGEWWGSFVQWLRSTGPDVLFKLFVILLILVIARLFARIAERLVGLGLKRSNVQMSNLLREFFIKTAGRIVLVFGVLIGIAQLGIEIGPLLAGLGIAGFIVGFALQGVLSNFASGLMILFYRPFDVGDTIEAAGIRGKVDKMTLVSTMILTFDNQLLVVPNNKIWGDVIRNVTHQTQRRIDFMFGIHYKDDIEHAERVFMDILTSHDKVLKYPEPMVRVHELGNSSVNFAVRPWVKTDDYWDVYWDLTREVKRRLDAEGITIPFPQRDVHHYAEKDGS